MTKQAICYYRVSTDKQGQSGLGLQAQKDVAKAYCQRAGYQIIDEHVEIVSGKINDRELVLKALADCEDKRATLIVAKLDRISRDVEFIAALQKSSVDFVCADMPEANSSMIQFMAVFAEYERKQISARTTAALKVKKDNGVKLGNPNIKNVKGGDIANANAKRVANSQAFAQRFARRIEEAKANGCTSLNCISRWLNANDFKTRRGGTWTPTAVSRVLKHLEAQAA